MQSGLTVTALINSAGQAMFIRSYGVQFVGMAQVSGTTLATTVDGYVDFGNTFSNGSTYGIGTVSGAVSTARGISATLTFTTNGGTSIAGAERLGVHQRPQRHGGLLDEQVFHCVDAERQLKSAAALRCALEPVPGRIRADRVQ